MTMLKILPSKASGKTGGYKLTSWLSSYVGHCHDRSGGSWSNLGGHTNGASGVAYRVDEL